LFLVVSIWHAAACTVATARSRPPVAVADADADADEDGVPDGVDQCPNDPEDYDGYKDGDGCPDPDDSGHVILDEDDRCPIVLDCEEGFIDFDGCPDVILVFESHSSQLDARGLELVDELAEELDTRGKVKTLRIDGHFAAGEEPDLAAQRSTAVRDRLVARGIPAVMLQTREGGAPDGSSGYVSFFAVECAD
jgi:outer membrane protein OmpA-like peptidoglycan-associated protein